MDAFKKALAEHLDTLPENIRDLIQDQNFYNKLTAIAQKNVFNPDDTANFIDETLLVLLGVENREDYLLNLRSVLSVNYDLVPAVAQNVHNEIFKPLESWFIEIARASGEVKPTPSVTDLLSKPLGNGRVETPVRGSRTTFQKDILETNLPVIEPQLEPMILPKKPTENQNPFLPPLRKPLTPSVNFTSATNTTTASTPELEKVAPVLPKPMTDVAPPNLPTGVPKLDPQMTSALAAEISNLLGEKNRGFGNQPAKPSAPKSIFPPQTNSASLQVPKTTSPIPETQRAFIPPSVSKPFPPLSSEKLQVPQRPTDKFGGLTQKPRVEVEMVKKDEQRPVNTPGREPKSDPYREPTE